MDRLNSLMRGSMMGGSSAPPGAVSEPTSKAITEHYDLHHFENSVLTYCFVGL